MGCGLSDQPLTNNLRVKLLTSYEIVLIKRSWDLIKDNHEFGMAIMLR
jgi:hypothetical protein